MAVDGLRNDRVMAVVVDGRVVTQREHPELSRVWPVLDDATGVLTLSVAGSDPVSGRLLLEGRTHQVTLFGQPVAVVEQSTVLSEWFTDVVGRPATLVGAPATSRRTTPGAVPGQTVLSDEGSVSVLSEASVRRLDEVLAEQGLPPVPADRFRANLLVDGIAAHAEDDATSIAVGDVVLGVADLLERCVVTTVDQQAGRRAGAEPLRTLARYRRNGGGAGRFGVHAVALTPGRLRVGDTVLLQERDRVSSS